MIQTYLPNLDDDDVHRCLFALYHRWTQRRHRTRPVFFFWLQGILDRERHRRTVEPPIEVETLEIPSGWSNRELLDGLDDATYLTYVDNVSDACGDMCDQIFITMQFLVCERLQ